MFSADEERGTRKVDGGTRIGRYYEKGIISACDAGLRRTGLRRSIYSERMALRWCTTIIIRPYWIIVLHLAIWWEQTSRIPRRYSRKDAYLIIEEALRLA